MNKFLRYSLVALLCAMFNVSFADDITFDFDKDYQTIFPGMGLSSGSGEEAVHDGDFTVATTSAAISGATVTVSPKAEGAQTDNRLWELKETGKGRLRLYSGTLTITAPANMDITAMNIAGVKWNKDNKVDKGTLNANSSSATWTGQAHEVVLSVAGNTQISSLTMTVVGAGQEIPAEITIKGNSPFVGSTTVEISINRESAQIYYTLDGSDPAGDKALLYEGPFTIKESCTVRAMDEISQAVAEKEFVKQDVPTVENIAAFLNLEENTDAVLTVKDAVVLGHGNNNTVIKDATGSVLVYYLGQDVKQGDKLNGTITAKRVVYAGVDEAKVEKGYTVDVIATAGTVTPVETTAAEIANKPVMTEVYKIKDAVIKEVQVSETSKRYYIFNGNSQAIQLYDEFKISGMISADGTYTVEGIRGQYNDTPQLWLTKVGEGEDPQPGEVVKAKNIAEFLAQPKNTVVDLTLDAAQVLYTFTTNNGNNSTYVRDNSGSVVFYNSLKGVEANEMLNGNIIVVRGEYNNNPQAIANNDTNIDGVLRNQGAEAEPVAVTFSQIKDNVNNLVTISNVTIVAKDNKYYITEGDTDVQVYNKFHLEAYEAEGLSQLTEMPVNITGIVEAFKDIFEICPIESGIVDGIVEVNVENEENGMMYNISGQRVNDSYKGIVIMNGKKMIKK